MAEWQIEHRKSSLVLSARVPVLLLNQPIIVNAPLENLFDFIMITLHKLRIDLKQQFTRDISLLDSNIELPHMCQT